MINNAIKGLGLGLRFPHFNDILNNHHSVPWFEVIADDFLEKGPHWDKLLKLREGYSIAMHSIGMNIGGVDEFNIEYLNSLSEIYRVFEPEFISDHLCWSSHQGFFHHDLLPIPRTIEGLENAVKRINFLQDFFKRELVVENITQYINLKNEEIDELSFIKELVARTDCKILLDISNVIINHKNRSLDFEYFFINFPWENVAQFHIAGGYKNQDGVWIDSHSRDVLPEDIEVLKKFKLLQKEMPGIIERDSQIPSFAELNFERKKVIECVYEVS